MSTSGTAMRRPTMICAAMGVLLLALGSACSAPDAPAASGAEHDPDGSWSASVDDWTSLPISPVTWVSTAGHTLGELQRDVDVDIGRCMAEQGFDYEPQTVVGDDTIPTPKSVLASAGVHGYGHGEPAPADDAEGSRVDYLAKMPADERARFEKAMHGTVAAEQDESAGGLTLPAPDEQGCDATARRDVFAGLLQFDPDFAEEAADILVRVDSDPALQQALGAWRTCMAHAGHDVQNPQEAFASVRDAPDSPEAVALAVDDSGCAAGTTMRTQQQLELDELARLRPRWPELDALVARMLAAG